MDILYTQPATRIFHMNNNSLTVSYFTSFKLSQKTKMEFDNN